MAVERGVTHLPAQPCPACQKTLTAAGTFDGADTAPGPGDWTICSGCLTWLVYSDGMVLRTVMPAEWLALTEEERVELERQRDLVGRAWQIGRDT